jgi:hypothetical protein
MHTRSEDDRTPTTSAFFNLPKEVRLLIYEICAYNLIRRLLPLSVYDVYYEDVDMSILQSCKQAHLEARLILQRHRLRVAPTVSLAFAPKGAFETEGVSPYRDRFGLLSSCLTTIAVPNGFKERALIRPSDSGAAGDEWEAVDCQRMREAEEDAHLDELAPLSHNEYIYRHISDQAAFNLFQCNVTLQTRNGTPIRLRFVLSLGEWTATEIFEFLASAIETLVMKQYAAKFEFMFVSSSSRGDQKKGPLGTDFWLYLNAPIKKPDWVFENRWTVGIFREELDAPVS